MRKGILFWDKYKCSQVESQWLLTMSAVERVFIRGWRSVERLGEWILQQPLASSNLLCLLIFQKRESESPTTPTTLRDYHDPSNLLNIPILYSFSSRLSRNTSGPWDSAKREKGVSNWNTMTLYIFFSLNILKGGMYHLKIFPCP